MFGARFLLCVNPPNLHFSGHLGTASQYLMDAAQLQQMAAQLGDKRKAEGPPSGCGALTKPHELSDLDSNASVLNAANSEALKAVLQWPAQEGAVPLKSDSDEQLLVSIAMPSATKLSAIRITGPDDGSAPKTVKIFANRLNMSFDDAEDFPPTQTIELPSANAGQVPLQLTKFLSVSSLTIFVESNQGDEEATGLNRLELVGVPLATTNMKDLKKVG